MHDFFFKGILQSDGWHENVAVSVNHKGIITQITNAQESKKCTGFALPGFQNAHSHAFQYAMAGLAELHPTTMKKNDFWSWRQSMYALALKVQPEHIEAIAAMLYKEMLRHGYTHVAEFHYIHRDIKGSSYENKAELSERIARAAQSVGIKLTIIPIYYEQGGFGLPAQKEQVRFLSSSFEDYLELNAAVKTMATKYKNCQVGFGIHSMRGVALENIVELAKHRTGNTPFHIHIAEQIKEIDECIAFTGIRPTEWFANNIELNENFHLIHATHLSENEISLLAKSGANVVICPSTEGNLGDGIFPLNPFLKKGGKWSIGTDSHIGLNPFEELRLLDYGQRLTNHSRNTFGNVSSGDNGAIAIKSALINGRKAMGLENEIYFKIGSSLDAVVITDKHPLIQVTGIKNLTNTIVYASDSSMIEGTIVGGEWKIINTENNETKIEDAFIRTIRALSNRL